MRLTQDTKYGIAVVGGILAFIALCVGGPIIYAASTATVLTTKDNWQTIHVVIEADASGAFNATTDNVVRGIIVRAQYEPDLTDTVYNTGQIGVYESWQYGNRNRYTASSSLLDVTYNTGTMRSTQLWPTSTIPVSSDLYFSGTGFTDSGGGGAKGYLILSIAPNVANGD